MIHTGLGGLKTACPKPYSEIKVASSESFSWLWLINIHLLIN